jgi:hypothetical protein
VSAVLRLVRDTGGDDGGVTLLEAWEIQMRGAGRSPRYVYHALRTMTGRSVGGVVARVTTANPKILALARRRGSHGHQLRAGALSKGWCVTFRLL